MPYHDLNLHYVQGTPPSTTSNTLAFAAELGYLTIALSTSVTGKLPPQPPLVPTSDLTIPSGMKLLTRLTLTVSDTSQNHRLSSLQSAYDLLALRPTNEKALQLCCSTLQCDIISIDFSQRLPFVLKFKTISSALQRGVRFEINYSPGILGGSDARRNVIAGATSLTRAARNRGIILSSEASNALGLRGPHDVINLACVWGLSPQRGREGVCEEANKVARLARLKRETFRGVVAVVDDGHVEPPKATTRPAETSKVNLPTSKSASRQNNNAAGSQKAVSLTDLKRKASSTSLNTPNPDTSLAPDEAPAPAEKPLSKRELKRRAKKARFEANQTANQRALKDDNSDDKDARQEEPQDTAIRHETLSNAKS